MAGGVKWFIANWKSNKNVAESLSWLELFGPQLTSSESSKVVVCPSTLAAAPMKKLAEDNHYDLMIGLQNISAFGVGAFTGELAAEQAKGVADLVIIGHSERRQKLGETDAMVADKVTQAKEAGLLALVCVQDANTPIPDNTDMVAYEPIWAIGSGTADTPENAAAVIAEIKQKVGRDIPVLYGGSVKADNAKTFLERDEIDGLLVGGASLDPQQFITIVQQWT